MFTSAAFPWLTGVIFLIVCSSNVVMGAIGPETKVTLSAYPYLVHLDDSVNDKSYLGLILSKNFAVTSSSFKETQKDSPVYSGNIESTAEAKKHAITRFYSNGKVTIVKLCPHLSVHKYKPISLKESDAFDYSTNETGSIVYFKRTDRKVYFRTEPVLSDASCKISDTTEATLTYGFDPSFMTCTKFDSTPKGCAYIRPRNVWKTFPVLVVQNKGVAVMYDCACAIQTESMVTISVFTKLSTQKSYILGNADVDLK